MWMRDWGTIDYGEGAIRKTSKETDFFPFTCFKAYLQWLNGLVI